MALILGCVLGGIALIALLILWWGIATYNSFVRLQTNIEHGYSNMDVFLKKRYDLIPRLVNSAKGYMAHENKTLESVVAARNAAASATDPADRFEKENALSSTLGHLFAVAEAYPQLKADSHVTELMQALQNIENEIASSRKYYNGCVSTYNAKVKVWPSSIIAKMKNFELKPFFEIAEDNREPVEVNLEY